LGERHDYRDRRGRLFGGNYAGVDYGEDHIDPESHKFGSKLGKPVKLSISEATLK
jgi:hypothetical protein